MDHMKLPSYAMHPCALASDGWMQWVETTFGLQPLRMTYSQPGKPLPRLEGVLYLNKRGAVRTPPLNPYMPFAFYSTNTSKIDALSAQWLTTSALLAEDLVDRGLIGSICLPPGMLDARSFQSKGFNVGVRYTLSGCLPWDSSLADNDVRRQIRKATDAGYVAERSDDWGAIMQCLEQTETAKSFVHRINVKSLTRASVLMGDDSFRGYVVRDSKGNAVSGGIRLHTPNGVAIDWVQGTLRDQLQYGVNQLIYAYVLEDLASAGAVAFDSAGANIPAVAVAKAAWRFPLIPYLTIRATDLRFMTRSLQSSTRWMMQGVKLRGTRK